MGWWGGSKYALGAKTPQPSSRTDPDKSTACISLFTLHVYSLPSTAKSRLKCSISTCSIYCDEKIFIEITACIVLYCLLSTAKSDMKCSISMCSIYCDENYLQKLLLALYYM